MLNSFMPHEMRSHQARNPNNSREKPASVLLYNQTMGTLDSVDNVIQRYNTSRKTRRWYKKVAFRFMDIAYHNVYVLYKMLDSDGRKTLSFKTFLLDLVDDILSKFPNRSQQAGRPSLTPKPFRLIGQHFPEKIVSSTGKSKQMDCGYCKRLTTKR